MPHAFLAHWGVYTIIYNISPRTCIECAERDGNAPDTARQTAREREREIGKCSNLLSLSRERQNERENVSNAARCVYVSVSVCVCVYLFACQKLCLDIGNDVSSNSNSSEKHKSKLLLLNRTQAPKISIALGNWTQAAPQRICVARAAACCSCPHHQVNKVSGC